MAGPATLYQTGDHASRPANGAGCVLYFCTDHDLIYRDDGASWTTLASLTVSDILNIPTAETDDTLVLAPDGAGGVEFRAEAGGASLGVWMPDAAPASPGAADDEFADAAGAGTPAGWTEFDPGALQTVSEEAYGLMLSQASSAGIDITGIYKAIPAGDFTIWSKLSLLAARANYSFVGLALWEDAANSAGDIIVISYQYSVTVDSLQVTRFSDHQTFSTRPVDINTDIRHSGIYLRIRRTGTTYGFDWSSDGIGWERIYTTAALGITPTHMGIVINNEASGTDTKGIAQFFRYLASDVGLTGVVSGGRV